MFRRPIVAIVYAVAITAVALLTFNGGGQAEDRAHALEPQGQAPELIWGDIDCSGAADAIDALKGLQFVASLPFQQPPGCPQTGSETAGGIWGDWDCSGAANAVDALQGLRNVAGLPVSQTQPCPAFGEPLGIPVEFEELEIEGDWRDYGDAPDGTATGYSAGAATGSFPTRPENGGPSHPFPFTVWLGETATVEDEPYDGGDADDGLQAFDLTPCDTSFALVAINGGDGSAGTAYVNLLADWNRDGDWEDGGCADEWAVQNQEIDVSDGGLVVTALEFTGGEQTAEFWSRLVVSTTPFDPAAGGEFAGETEDYLVSGDGSLTVPARAGVAAPQGGGSAGGGPFFCKGLVYAHDEFLARTLQIEQTSASKDAGFSPTEARLGYGKPQTADGNAASGVGITVHAVNPAREDDGRLELRLVSTIQATEDPPERLEGPFIIPIVIEGQSNKGPFRTALRCGLYIDHSAGGGMSGLDGFRGGPGRAGKSPGASDPAFVVISHGDRVALHTDANVDKETADASSYDPDSLRVFDENGTLLSNDTLSQSAGIRDVIVPTKGRGIIIDTVEDDRHPSTQTIVIRLQGKDQFGIPFTDYFRVIINHDGDASTKTVIKKLLDSGVALHSFGPDEALAIAYTAGGDSVRSRIPPIAGFEWEERTHCVLGDNASVNSVRDLMFGSLAYVVDYPNGGSEIVLRRDAGGHAQTSGEDDDDCWFLVEPPGFEVLTNNGEFARIRNERGNICAGRLVAAEFNLAEPGIPFGLIEAEIEELVLRSARGGEPAGASMVKPIPGGASHRYPHCFKMGGGKYGIVASTPGEENRSVLAYVPFIPCGGTCVAEASPQGNGGFVLLVPAGPNDHFVRAAVSPDGMKIAFQYDVRTELGELLNSQVYVGDFNPSIPAISNAAPVTFEGLNGLPAWSPDSQQIAFVSTRDGNLEIYVMNADGSNQTNLTNTPDVNESVPSWQSP